MLCFNRDLNLGAALTVIIIGICLLKIMVGLGLLKLQEWARQTFIILLKIMFIFLVIMLIGTMHAFVYQKAAVFIIILGLILAVTFIYYYTRPIIRAQFR